MAPSAATTAGNVVHEVDQVWSPHCGAREKEREREHDMLVKTNTEKLDLKTRFEKQGLKIRILENSSGPPALRRPRRTRQHGRAQGTGCPEDAQASIACAPESVARGHGSQCAENYLFTRTRKDDLGEIASIM